MQREVGEEGKRGWSENGARLVDGRREGEARLDSRAKGGRSEAREGRSKGSQV